MSQRKLEYLIKNQIIYRRSPINDLPTKVYYWGSYYADGTYECYELFRSKAKITSFKSLKWHLLVLSYLNPHVDELLFTNLSRYLCNIRNNFITFNVSEISLTSIIEDVRKQDLEIPPINKRRKIIFKEFSLLTVEEKLVIVGQMVGRSKIITQEDIYEMMIQINDIGKKITINNISEKLNCSTRTIYRTIGDDLKKEKDILNNRL
tara:strand:- start:8240 stop:8857 length:618 start_codon:yes stop_codon:yes gene_type:complete